MDFITAKQLIYTRVETKYSPVRKSEFQTYYASLGLSPSMIKEIEDSVRVFDVSKTGNQGKKFFCLKDGQVVVAHSQSIATDHDINDSAGRPGVFIVHCLIFSRQDFLRIENNPFYVFDSFPFLANPAEMVSNYNQKEGREVSVSIRCEQQQPMTVTPAWIQKAAALDDIKTYVLTDTKQEAVLVYGGEDDIDAFFRSLLALCHPSERLHCWFETHGVQLASTAVKFKWVGLPTDSSKYGIKIDASRRSISGSFSPTGNNFYHQWLKTLEQYPERIAHLGTFQELGYAYENVSWPETSKIKMEGCEQFVQLFPDVVKTGIWEAFSKQVSDVFANSFTDYYIEKHKNLAHLACIAVSRTIAYKYFVFEARSWLAEKINRSEWNKKDIREMYKLFKKSNDNVLGFGISWLQRKPQKGELYLEKMSDQDYRFAIQLINRPIPIIEFIHPKFQNVLAEVLGPMVMQIKEDEFCDLVEGCLDLEMGLLLDVISPRLTTLGNQELSQVEKLLKKCDLQVPAFRQKLSNRRNELGKPFHFRNWFIK